MGCGGSTAAGAGSAMSKDPEDYHLDPLHFKKMHVPAFDKYLKKQIEPTVNKVVDIVNTINTCIDDIKDAATIICGGYKVEVDVKGKSADAVAVTLTKPDGTYPTAEEVDTLTKDAKVKAADDALSKALKALKAAMEKKYVKLKLDPTNNVATDDAAPPAEIAAFNKALGDLRTAVGANYKVVVGHKAAAVPGAAAVRVSIKKFSFPKPDSSEYKATDCQLLDLFKSKEAKTLYNAELAIAEAMAGVTKAIKAAEEAGVKVTLTYKNKKVAASFGEGKGKKGAAAKGGAKKAAAPKKPAAKPKAAPKPKEEKAEGEEGEGEEKAEGAEEGAEAAEGAAEEGGAEAEAAAEEGGAEAEAGGEAEVEGAEEGGEEGGDDAGDDGGDDDDAGDDGAEAEDGDEKAEEGAGGGEGGEDGEGGSKPKAAEKPKKVLTPEEKAAKKAADEKAAVQEEKKAGVRKSISALNSQLFKLSKAARNSNGPVNVAKALLRTFEEMKKKVAQLAGKDDIKDLIKISPGFKVGLPEEGGAPEVNFDWGLKINLPDVEDLDAMDALRKLLPSAAMLVIDAVLAVKDKLMKLLPEFVTLAKLIMETVSEAENVFSDPMTKIKEAIGDDLDMMKLGKMGAAATGNLKIVTTEPVKVVKTLKDTIVRLSDELSGAAEEVKAAFA